MTSNAMDQKVFDQFTRKYSLSKTLRFELKPCLEIPEDEKEKLFGGDRKYYENCRTYTEYHLKKANKEYYSGEKTKNADLQLINFLHDQRIEDAYQILKPVFDKLHEEFITESLESDEAKTINFGGYYDLYKEQKDKQNKDEKKKLDKPLEIERGKLRKAFAPIYEAESEKFKSKAGKDKKGKNILKESGFKILTEAGILKYIKNNIDGFANKELKNKEGKEVVKKDIEEALGTKNNEGIFDRFFTYFGGFNQNRENYYSIDEKATAVASRIVDENLPKFCDNIITYKKNKNDYLRIFDFLKSKDKDLKLKNTKFGKENEPEFIPAHDIKNDEKSFFIKDFVNCLSQDEIDQYNAKIANANYLINLYNYNKDKNSPKLSMFKILYKQIGCGEKKDFIDKIKDDNELEHILEKAAEAGKKYFIGKNSGNGEISNIFDFINYIQNHENYKGIYWSDKALNTISSKYFANWDTLKNKLGEAKVFNKNTGEDKADNKYKIPQAVMLSDLFTVLDDKTGKAEENEKWREREVFFKVSLFEGDKDKSKIIENADRPSQALLGMICDDIENLAKNFTDYADEILKISENDYKKDENKQKIKNWLDNALWISQILKYFRVNANKVKGDPIDAKIDNGLKLLVDSDDNPVSDYDIVRNYLTQKPQDEINKLKLNFEKPNLLGGFVESKTENSNAGTQYGGYILRRKKKDGKYSFYLGVSQDTQLFSFFEDGKNNLEERVMDENDRSEFERLNYYQVKTTSIYGTGYVGNYETEKKNIVSFINKYVENNGNQELKDIIKKESEKKQPKINTPKGYLNFLQDKDKNIYNSLIKSDGFIELSSTVINNLKETLNGYVKRVPIVQNIIDKIENNKNITLSEIQNDIDDLSNEKTFIYKAVSEKEFNEVTRGYNENNKKQTLLYLFEIKIADKKLLNRYFLALLSGNQNVFDLGKGEIFYRSASNKMERKVKTGYEDKKDKVTGKNYIIEKKRFTEPKFLLHLSIIVNYKEKKDWKNCNDEINDKLLHSENLYFLGIDRGEKHLAYYSLVNQKGEILEQGTLNLPFIDKNGNRRSVIAEKKYFEKDKNGRIVKDERGNDKIKTEIAECWDYNDLLEARAGDRDYARRNWTTIGTIKELKDGYISQVIRKIVDLAIYENVETKELRKMPAFIVLEDLNIGFKRGRQKIEKQVYQKLELALAKKLNFLVDKNAEEGEIGSVTKAIQLTPPVNNFGDMENRKQFGNMLYIRADYTSQTDPVTGWRKSIYLKSDSEQNVRDQIKNSFSDIRYEDGDYCFEYKDRHGKVWKLYSGKNGVSLDRFHRERNSKNVWESERQPLNKMLDILFDEKRLDKSKSLYKQMFEECIELTRLPKELNKKDKPAWESLRFVIALIQQIRNTGTDARDGDFILSPVRDEKTGEHFDSRVYLDKEQNGEKADLPTSGDANGAYNIARKGIIVAERIKKGLDKLYISDEEWDAWLAGKEIWEKWLEKNRNNPNKAKK